MVAKEQEKSMGKSGSGEHGEFEDDLSLGIEKEREKEFPLSDSLKETADRLGVVAVKESSKSMSCLV